jgi:hypothetical protein
VCSAYRPGIVLSRSLAAGYASDFLGDLAGNSFCAFSLMAILVSFFVVIAGTSVYNAADQEADGPDVTALLDEVSPGDELLSLLEAI